MVPITAMQTENIVIVFVVIHLAYFDAINYPFTNREFKWNKIIHNTNKIFLYHSTNDPYVPLSKAIQLAEYLNIKPIIVKNAGHFNEKAGLKNSLGYYRI